MRQDVSRSKTSQVLLALWVALSLLAAGLISAANSTAAFAAMALTVGGKAVVTNTGGDPIRIRQDAGTDFPLVTVAREGQTVGILGGPRLDKKGGPWFKVQAVDGTGWMAAVFLQATSLPPAVKLTGYARAANLDGDPLRVRSDPSVSGKVLTLLDPGTIMAIQAGPVTDATGVGWYKVTAKGVMGWAMAQYMVQEPASAEPAARKEAPPQAKPVVTPKPTAIPQPAAKPTPQPPAQPAAPVPPSTTSSKSQYRQWVEEARTMYPYKQSVDKMWSVMQCESGGNPRASGGGGRYIGLFQYAPATWGGGWNPYRGSSIYDGKSQIFATAKAWSIGMQGSWSCYYITPGR